MSSVEGVTWSTMGAEEWGTLTCSCGRRVEACVDEPVIITCKCGQSFRLVFTSNVQIIPVPRDPGYDALAAPLNGEPVAKELTMTTDDAPNEQNGFTIRIIGPVGNSVFFSVLPNTPITFRIDQDGSILVEGYNHIILDRDIGIRVAGVPPETDN